MNPTTPTAIKMPYESAIKYAFILIIVIIAVVFLSKIIKAIAGSGELDTAKKQIDNNQLTYNLADYERFANQLEQAFKGWGTTEDTVVRIIKKMRNSSDYYKLVQVFGTRKIGQIAWTKTEGTLTTHLEYELDDNPKEKQLVYSWLNSIGISI